MTGAQDFSDWGELGKRKNSWHRIQLSSYQELARVSGWNLTCFASMDRLLSVDGEEKQSFPKRIPFGGRWFGWICWGCSVGSSEDVLRNKIRMDLTTANRETQCHGCISIGKLWFLRKFINFKIRGRINFFLGFCLRWGNYLWLRGIGGIFQIEGRNHFLLRDKMCSPFGKWWPVARDSWQRCSLLRQFMQDWDSHIALGSWVEAIHEVLEPKAMNSHCESHMVLIAKVFSTRRQKAERPGQPEQTHLTP